MPTAGPAQPTGTVVEYFHAGFDHYFITAYAHEIALLDGGAYGGVWSRTGRTFPVWTGPGPGTAETCRFFSAAFAPRSSHFYTPFAAECDLRRQDPAWTFEAVAFHLQPAPAGTCPAGTMPLYRLYNNAMSGAPNHRYTVERATFDQMRGAGWTAEGNGPQTVFACVPAAATVSGPHGLWGGSTSANALLHGIVLADGSFYFLYTLPSSETIAGLVQGTLSVAGTGFTSSDARDYSFAPFATPVAAAISGTFVAGSTLSGSIVEGGSAVTFTAEYAEDSRAPPDPALAAGTYAGVGATAAGYEGTVVTISASGALAGSSGACAFSGAATPRADVQAFDLTVGFHGAPCALGNATITGIAVYDTVDRMLFAAGVNAARTDGFVFVGAR